MPILLFGLYLICWIALVVHWWRRKSFFPIFGTGRSTRIWWGVTFLFFHPLLSLLYLVYGVLHRPPAERTRPIPPIYLNASRAAVLILSFLVVVLFRLPSGTRNTEPIVADSRTEPRDDGLTLKAHATSFKSSNNTSSFSSYSSHTGSRLGVRDVLITVESDHPLLHKIALHVQEALTNLPMVDRVVYLPAGLHLEEPQRLPGMFVNLQMPAFHEVGLPGVRKVEAEVEAQASVAGPLSDSHVSRENDPPLVEFSIGVQVQHASSTAGIETAGAVYDQEAKSIGEQTAGHIVKKLTEMAEKSGILPPYPDYFYGPYEPAPPLPFLDAEDLTMLFTGTCMMSTNRTVWTYRDDRPTTVAIQSMRDALARDGWPVPRNAGTYEPFDVIEFERGNEIVKVFRKKKPHTRFVHHHPRPIGTPDAAQSPEPPMIAMYERRFTRAETNAALERLINEGADVDTLIPLSPAIRRAPEALRDQYDRLLVQSRPSSINACIELVRFYNRRDETARALDALDQARAYVRLLKAHNPRQGDFKKLAKELNAEEHLERPIPESALHAVGLIPLDGLTSPVTRTVRIGQPVGFYRYGENKESGDPVQTVAFAVIEDTSPSGRKTAPKQARDHDPRSRWRIQRVTKYGGSTLSSTSGGRIENGVWEVDQSASFPREADRAHLRIKAKQTGEDRITFTATPE